MTSVSVSDDDFMEENGVGSDSDTNPDDDAPEYYQPISAVDDDDEEENYDHQLNSDEDHQGFQASDVHGLSNGYRTYREAENGISSLHLNDDVEQKSSSEDEEDEEERVVRDASASAISRAFREDETRRNAPLTQENASMVVEAIRGVSFVGLAPDWATQVPEDRWIDQLRRSRQPSALRSDTSSTAQN